MNDCLHIAGLKVETYIGIHAWEQRILQPLFLDIKIPMDFAACQNNIENTIDYAALCEFVTNYVATNRFELIETVAEKVIEEIKKTFPILQLSVTVSKPHAVKNAANISVVVNR